MTDTLTIRPSRPNSIGVAVLWVVLLFLAGTTIFLSLFAILCLTGDIGAALILAILAALFGWPAWILFGSIVALRRMHATFRGREVTVVRVRASKDRFLQLETCTIDLGRCVRIDHREYLTQGIKGVPISNACTWVTDDQGNSTVLASGRDDCRAAFAKKVADELARRTGLTPSSDRAFRFIGIFGGAVPAVFRPIEQAPDLKTWFLRLPKILFGSD